MNITLKMLIQTTEEVSDTKEHRKAKTVKDGDYRIK